MWNNRIPASQIWIQSWCCYLWVGWSGKSFLNVVSLSFLLCKTEIEASPLWAVKSRHCVYRTRSTMPEPQRVLSEYLTWVEVVLEKTLESPLDCKIQPVHPKGDQSWMFIGSTDVEAETQYFGHLMWRADSFEKTLMLGKIEGEGGGEGDDRGWYGWMASLTQWTWVWLNSGSWWWTGRPGRLQSMGSQRVGHDRVTELKGLQKWSMALN